MQCDWYISVCVRAPSVYLQLIWKQNDTQLNGKWNEKKILFLFSFLNFVIMKKKFFFQLHCSDVYRCMRMVCKIFSVLCVGLVGWSFFSLCCFGIEKSLIIGGECVYVWKTKSLRGPIFDSSPNSVTLLQSLSINTTG